MRFPRNAPFAAVTRNAPATFFRRCAAESPTWLWVRLILATGTPVSFSTTWASMADWLKRRDQSLDRQSGTGTMISASASSSAPAAAIQRPKRSPHADPHI